MPKAKQKHNKSGPWRVDRTPYGLGTSLAPKMLSPFSFLALAWAKRDFGLALSKKKRFPLATSLKRCGEKARAALEQTYLLTCLLRKALILAEQGLMMLSEGETYCFALDAKLVLVGHRGITMIVVGAVVLASSVEWELELEFVESDLEAGKETEDKEEEEEEQAEKEDLTATGLAALSVTYGSSAILLWSIWRW